ncbi:alpha/beta hydrolase [Williamsia sterculiae]|uniref:Diacylglycerol O-acyltransferase / trehalose O-mycolyltransferase n=1 Tax=Williamsia sterculiae TaxID=1344003 RepID=A0A1N7FEQ4_9NOCA|nr:alpha/beta hydrolase family protein [Williamsia sterculiae]SIR98898.1 diacylglycerol O-acyltransferase / trehalose O-mycolyltransferase [Williamsia sterculiae]
MGLTTAWSRAGFLSVLARPTVLRPLVIGVAASLVLFALTAMLLTQTKAKALVGHPEILRPGCTWDVSKNYVQNCKVWSPSQNKFVVVQIRASNGSDKGVYLLDGMRARDDRSAWTTDVQAARVYDGSTDTTLVMPAGGASTFNTDWQGGAGAANTPVKQETFLTSELPAYLQQQFGVSPSNNAIVGISMSAGPAVTLAEKHPEQFRVVQAMSGYYQTDNPLGWLGVFGTQTVVSNYTNGIVNMWGLPGSTAWKDNDASKNLAKLKENGQVLILSSGNAMLTPQEQAKIAPQDQISAILLEALAAASTVLLQLQLKQAGVSVITLPNYGGHDWDNWNRGLTSGRDQLLDVLRKPPVTTKTTVIAANELPDPTTVTSTAATTSEPSTTATSVDERVAQVLAQQSATTTSSGTSTETTVVSGVTGTPQAGSNSASATDSAAPSSTVATGADAPTIDAGTPTTVATPPSAVPSVTPDNLPPCTAEHPVGTPDVPCTPVTVAAG